MQMKHFYLFFALAAALVAMPSHASESYVTDEPAQAFETEAPTEVSFEMDSEDEGLNAIEIRAYGKYIRIKNAADQVLQIYNLAGECVGTYKIENDETTIQVNLNDGCYMIKVGKVVRKISIKKK